MSLLYYEKVRNILFFAIFFGLIVGIVTESYLRFGGSFIFLFLILSIAFSITRYFFERKLLFHSLAIFFLCVSFGAIRADYSEYKYNSIKNELSTLVGTPHEFSGMVVGGVSHGEQTTKFFVSLSGVKSNEGSKNIEGIISVVASRETTVFYGDEIRISGTITEPKSFVTERGDVFDYSAYLATRGAHYVMLYPKISVLGGNKSTGIIGKLVSLKTAFEEKTKAIFGEPEASLLNGILFGANDSLGEPLTTNLKNTSTIHIAVLSGYNIALVVIALLFMTSFLPKLISILFSIIGIVLFVAMVGVEPPAVRSAIMAIVALSGLILGRPYDAGRALFVAIALMLFQNPEIYGNPSFILSCLATFGIIFLTPIFSLLFSSITNRYNFRELLATTISAQLSVTPYLVYLVGVFSVVALPANILVLPVIPLIMIFGFISVLASFVVGVIALPLFAITHVLLSYLISVVSFFGGLSFATISLGIISGIYTLLFYVIMVIVFLFIHRKVRGNEK
ncbi:MAG: ComEC/Rec2 family competence protein [Candidatus Paceibacterota bacterium]|jgi:competence protein ComEC